MMRENAVVLLSGGLDSATVLALAAEKKYKIWALSFQYGQHAHLEVELAGKLCETMGIHKHLVIPLALGGLVESALVGDRTVPAPEDCQRSFGIPETYVPARNTVFLSIAMGLAESIKAYTIFLGANSLDYSGYPDCRPEFIERFNDLAAIATAEGSAGGRAIRVEAPLMKLSKAQIIELGVKLGLNYGLTMSCYQPVGTRSCGTCESCLLRLKGFKEAGLQDPAPYTHSCSQ
jgi:7-cyano-7-deazaguanine synthase